jgi:hypothetical protein
MDGRQVGAIYPKAAIEGADLVPWHGCNTLDEAIGRTIEAARCGKSWGNVAREQ